MRATLKAARSKCGASLVPSSERAMRRRSAPVAIADKSVTMTLNVAEGSRRPRYGCEGAEAQPARELPHELRLSIERDSAGAQRFVQPKIAHPHLGQGDQVGLYEQLHVETWILQADIDRLRLQDQPPAGTTVMAAGHAAELHLHD